MKWSYLIFLACVLALAGCAGAEGSPPEEAAVETTRQAAVEATLVVPTQNPETAQPTAGTASTPQPAIPERRLMTVEWPSRVRVGDSDLVRLTLEVDEKGNITPTVEVSGNQVKGETVLIPNLYETHNILAEARLEMTGIEFTPQGEVSEPLQPGRTVKYYWSLQPGQVGTYRGAVWLHLRLIPFDDNAQESRMLLSVQKIEIEAVNFLGLGGVAARLVGGVGTVVGSLLGLDNLIGWGWKLIRRKRTSANIETD
jgi:hypothetical protein